MKTLLLDRTAWDLALDSLGNIALADEPYSIAQDVASAIKTFLGECWYDTRIGLPYFEQVLDKLPPVQLLQKLVETQALTVPGVTTAKCTITEFTDRTVRGFVEVNGTDTVEFSNGN